MSDEMISSCIIWVKNLKGKDQFEDPGRQRAFEKLDVKCENWIQITENCVQSWNFMNTVMNIYILVEELSTSPCSMDVWVL